MPISVSCHGGFFFIAGGPFIIHRVRSNGLIGDAGRSAIRVTTGYETNVPVTTQALAEPEPFEYTAWDVAAEHDVVVGGYGLALANDFGEYVRDGPEMAVAGPGLYRVRVAVRGRDFHVPGLYHLQAWPTTTAEPPRLLTDLDPIGQTLVQDEWIGGLEEPDPGDLHPLAYLPPRPAE